MRQLKIMISHKSILLNRYFTSTIIQTFGTPFAFLMLLFILQQSDYQHQLFSNSLLPSTELDGVSNCQGISPQSPCINILFTPLNPNTTLIMKSFINANALRTHQMPWKIQPMIHSLNALVPTQSVVPVPDPDFIYEFALKSPNITQWAIVFNFNHMHMSPPTIHYEIWYNASLVSNHYDAFGNSLISLVRGIDEAIISVLNDPSLITSAHLNIKLKDWPLVPSSTLSDTVVQELGPVFFFCSVMVIFINALNNIVIEKESKSRHAMEMMGLSRFNYWASHFISNAILVTIGSVFTTILGNILGFKAFVLTNVMVIFITFLLLGLGMVSFALFLSTIIKKSHMAIVVGICIFILGLLFESFVFSSGYIGYIWWRSSTPSIIRHLFYLLPFFNFGKAFLDITTYTTGRLDKLTNTYIQGPGFHWAALFETIPENVQPIYGDGIKSMIPPPIYSFYFIVMDIVIYLFLAFYLDHILPNEFGMSLKPWFLFTKQYWKVHESNQINQTSWIKSQLIGFKQSNKLTPECSQSVLKERERILNSDDRENLVIIFNLHKTYFNSIWDTNLKSKSLDGLFLAIEKNSLLALIGENGSGKTTLVNILSGMISATTGDALVAGFSIKTQMHRITKLLGVCPQHDILFDELTAKEHIRLYAGLKQLDANDIESLLEKRLHAVRLDHVANERVCTYSGGMKRRLSLLIATIGDPMIMFLDEPTRGMDPVNRRHVWKFIKSFKKDRVIIMTTHSMEEADVLGDRIAIMSKGKLTAIGTAAEMIQEYGEGFKISIMIDPKRVQEAKTIILEKVPNAILVGDFTAGSLTYQFNSSSYFSIPTLMRFLDSECTGLVRKWGISQTTIQEVFLKVIKKPQVLN